jgi:hypothetical protein
MFSRRNLLHGVSLDSRWLTRGASISDLFRSLIHYFRSDTNNICLLMGAFDYNRATQNRARSSVFFFFFCEGPRSRFFHFPSNVAPVE